MRPEIEYVYNKLKKLRFDFKLSEFNDFRNYYRYDPELMRYVRKDDNDLFIDKNTFKPLEEELEYADSCHKVEEQIGCPLDVVVKVLEIIKEKLVDVFKLYNCKTIEEYNQAQYRDCMLTKEEFNLLKEVLK